MTVPHYQPLPTPVDDLAPPSLDAAEFIARWQASAAAERANYALFLTQLCDLLYES
jgi:hypothetical protein